MRWQLGQKRTSNRYTEIKKRKEKCDKVKPPDKEAAIRGRPALLPEIKEGVGGAGSVVRRKEQTCEGQLGTACVSGPHGSRVPPRPFSACPLHPAGTCLPRLYVPCQPHHLSLQGWAVFTLSPHLTPNSRPLHRSPHSLSLQLAPVTTFG